MVIPLTMPVVPPEEWSFVMPDASIPRVQLVLHMDATLPDIRNALEMITKLLHCAQVPDHACDDVQLVLAEIMTNIARHAYPHLTGWISCTVALLDGRVECLVQDGGLAYDPAALGQELPAPSLMAEGGYGWALIHALAQDLRYMRLDAGNQLRFQIIAQPHHQTV
jgi:serine/threonine-protein kinase RsbW